MFPGAFYFSGEIGIERAHESKTREKKKKQRKSFNDLKI